jgi:hypothetical protein
MRLPFWLYVLASLALLVLDCLTPVESVEWVLHVLLVWGVTLSASPRQIFWAGGISSACVVVGAWVSPGSYLPNWLLLVDRVVVMSAIWIIVSTSIRYRKAEDLRRSTSLQLEESLREIKVLRGIIPICMSCKRIRSDSGAWHQIEVYIRDHSEAEFSHGLCEECKQRLYPEFSALPTDS